MNDQLNKLISFFSFVFSHNTTSPQWALNKKDLLKGLATAGLSAPAAILYSSVLEPLYNNLMNGAILNIHFVIDWRVMAIAGLGAIWGYLTKNFVSTTPK